MGAGKNPSCASKACKRRGQWRVNTSLTPATNPLFEVYRITVEYNYLRKSWLSLREYQIVCPLHRVLGFATTRPHVRNFFCEQLSGGLVAIQGRPNTDRVHACTGLGPPTPQI